MNTLAGTLGVVSLLALVSVFAAACEGANAGVDGAGPGASGASAAYLSDPGFRRATLVASLVNPDNGYSRLRLASYETQRDGDWSRLDEWNPRVAVVAARELDGEQGAGAEAPLGADARALAIPAGAERGEEADLVALGEEAFFRYPVQLEPAAETAASSRSAFARYGFWTDEVRGAGGLVRVEVAGGGRMLAYTCATCHATTRDGALVVGLGNERLDLGRLAFDRATQAAPPSDDTARWLAWGPGRIDVTTAEGIEPVRIADLRPVRGLTHLQADASVAQHDRTALAIRIETLIITSHGMTVRPPRVVALGLAAYVWSLADRLPAARALDAQQARGAEIFQSTCARCHAPPAFTGPPVALDVVGTDGALGRSPDRGTGTYRVPSLRGVAARGALLHDASLPSLAAMFDPSRVGVDFAGGRRGPGAVPGHVFGLALEETARADLLSYLAAL